MDWTPWLTSGLTVIFSAGVVYATIKLTLNGQSRDIKEIKERSMPGLSRKIDAIQSDVAQQFTRVYEKVDAFKTACADHRQVIAIRQAEHEIKIKELDKDIEKLKSED